MSGDLELTASKLADTLARLEEAVAAPMYDDRSNIDATIHRFKFAFDFSCYFLKGILEEKGTEVRSPKDVLQAAFYDHLISDEKMWLAMLHDRNRTSHAYDEALADEIFQNIRTYVPILRATFDALKAHII